MNGGAAFFLFAALLLQVFLILAMPPRPSRQMWQATWIGIALSAVSLVLIAIETFTQPSGR